MNNVGGAPAMLLTSIGRRSGQPRTAPVLYVADGERLVVISSNGGNHAPAWSYNLKANPDAEVEIRGERRLVRARVAEGEERAELWQKMNGLYSGFDDYDRVTPARSRCSCSTHASLRLMGLFGRDKTAMVEPSAALPGRPQSMPVPDAPRGARHAAAGAVPRGRPDRDLRHGLLLGRRADLLGSRRRLHDRGRLRRRDHARTPPTRRSAADAPATPRSCSSPSTPPRPATRRCCGCSGRGTTRPRACARATTSAPSTARC